MLNDWFHKTVRLRFDGRDLELDLSHGLFSSFEVDRGTLLLLKGLAKMDRSGAPKRVLDLGCGTGPLALALKVRHPEWLVQARDRDALAAAATAHNAQRNRQSLPTDTGLGLDGLPGPWDWIVSNLPAKAGAPVLEHLLHQARARLAPGGLLGLVIVQPLAGWLSETLQAAGGEILFQEDGPQHRALVWRRPESDTPAPGEGLDPYWRTQARFKAALAPVHLRTAYGLPNFDSLDYGTELVYKGLKSWPAADAPVLVWNPGQGHLPLLIAKKTLSQPLTLAGRDHLALEISAANLRDQAPLEVRCEPVWAFEALSAPPVPYSQVLVRWEETPEVAEESGFWRTLDALTGPQAQVLLVGTSHDLQDLLKFKKGWPVLLSLKHRGQRLVVLEK